MKKVSDTVTNGNGVPQQGVVVSVTSYPSGAPATIYSGNGTGAYTGNSVTTNNLGYYEYYVPSGRYTKTFSIAGAIYETIQDLLEFDPADGTVAVNILGGSIGSTAFTGGSFNGSITNNATISGGTYASPTLSGTVTSTATINGGTVAGATLTGGSATGTTLNLTDSGAYYTTKTVEAALQQVGFQILQSVLTPEFAGATGASPSLDTAAWQTILADSRRIECKPGRVYQINAALTASVRKRIHMNGATLQATSAMTHLFTNAVNQLVMCDGIIDGNSLVTDCLTFSGGGNSVFEAMTFKRALRDTVWFGTTGVNDQVLFNTCFAQQAGTTYTSLTASTTAASATVTLSGTPNALVRVGDFIVITGAGGGYGAGNIHVITGISGATLTLDNSNASLVPANTVTNAACNIYSGSGWHFTHGTDSNLAILQNCNSSNTAACGAQDESLYGHRNINTDHQAALIGTSVGLLGTATTSNVYLAPPYYEQSSLTLDVLYQQGNNLKIDSAVLPTLSKFAYTPGNVFALGWQFQNGNNSLIRNYQEYVNAGTITLTDEQDMTFVQSGGAGNVTVKLPDAPYFADRPQVFNFNFAAVNGKTFTFTSTSSNATLINGVAGLTGVPFTPANYTSKKGVWSKNQNGWVIA